MREFLIGLGSAFLVGCGPHVDCGWAEFDDFDTSPAPPGKCTKIVVGDPARVAVAPADGCNAEHEAASCVILMPGESAAAFLPPSSVALARVTGTRQNGILSDAGACPLACD